MRWMQSDPLPRLLLMKIVVNPLTDLLNLQLRSSGMEFERTQRAAAAKCTMTGEWDYHCRSYQLTQAAKGEVEKKFFQRLKEIQSDTELWQLFPISSHTAAFKSLCHRLLSRAGASVHELFATPHQKFPYQMFALLERPDLATTIRSLTSCIKDEWSRGLENMYPSLGGANFFMVLLAHCLLQKTDIASIESRHASVRRQLTARSTQTWRFGLAACSAEWILQNCRTDQSGVSKKAERRRPGIQVNPTKLSVTPTNTRSACTKKFLIVLPQNQSSALKHSRRRGGATNR